MSAFLRGAAWLFAACWLCAGAAQAQEVRFAPEADYGPFIFQQADGEIAGLSLEFLQEISRNAGLTLNILPAKPLADILNDVAQGQVDVVSSLRPTPQRAKYLGFTKPYVQIPAVVVGRSNSSRRLELAALAGAKVAVGKGYAVEAFVRRAYPHIRWQAMPSDSVALHQLLVGEVDAVVADIASVSFIVKQEALEGLQLGTTVGFDYPLSMAYRKEDKALGQALERGLAAIQQPQRLAILNRWMPNDALPRQQQGGLTPQTLGLFGLLLAALLAAWALWRRQRGLPTE